MFKKLPVEQEFNKSVDINIIFGITKRNMSQPLNYWNTSGFGSIVRDEAFDPSSVEYQQYLYNFCSYLRNSDVVLDVNSVSCWIEDFFQYLRDQKVPHPIEGHELFMSHLTKWMNET